MTDDYNVPKPLINQMLITMRKLAGYLMIGSALFWYGALAFPLPWKVTDPREPGFEIQKFKFADYESSLALTIALQEIFPVGTDKSNVDDLLIYQAGAEIEKYPRKPASPDPQSHTRYYYRYSNFRSYLFSFIPAPGATFSWNVTAVYDENDRLTHIIAI